ncbi:hypothetical protein [Paenibacillus hamazuiensis]|uniref:hypothetical protein n=1 Tax=Paenibacillus hamazuiensis TaxID=2936508 RepID=UPI00200DA0D5|nr:hypothetical protein [Paenibacillus hamazuiensis]
MNAGLVRKMKVSASLSAIFSIAIAFGYRQNVFDFSFLGSEAGSASGYVDLWSTASVAAGIYLLVLLLFAAAENKIVRIIKYFILLGIFVLAAFQLPPLFWWTFAGMGDVKLFVGAAAHLLLLGLTFWACFPIFDSLRKENMDTNA